MTAPLLKVSDVAELLQVTPAFVYEIGPGVCRGPYTPPPRNRGAAGILKNWPQLGCKKYTNAAEF
jgi:hypothetical protein